MRSARACLNSLRRPRVLRHRRPVVDVEFRPRLPEINYAVEWTWSSKAQGHRDRRGRPADRRRPGPLRLHAATDGLVRGAPVRNTGRGIAVPVGTRPGHVFNVLASRSTPTASARPRLLGDPPQRPGLRPARALAKMFETASVIDLLEPYVEGGKIGLFGGAAWADRPHLEMINRVPPTTVVFGVRRRRRAHP